MSRCTTAAEMHCCRHYGLLHHGIPTGGEHLRIYRSSRLHTKPPNGELNVSPDPCPDPETQP